MHDIQLQEGQIQFIKLVCFLLLYYTHNKLRQLRQLRCKNYNAIEMINVKEQQQQQQIKQKKTFRKVPQISIYYETSNNLCQSSKRRNYSDQSKKQLISKQLKPEKDYYKTQAQQFRQIKHVKQQSRLMDKTVNLQYLKTAQKLYTNNKNRVNFRAEDNRQRKDVTSFVNNFICKINKKIELKEQIKFKVETRSILKTQPTVQEFNNSSEFQQISFLLKQRDQKQLNIKDKKTKQIDSFPQSPIKNSKNQRPQEFSYLKKQDQKKQVLFKIKKMEQTLRQQNKNFQSNFKQTNFWRNKTRNGIYLKKQYDNINTDERYSSLSSKRNKNNAFQRSFKESQISNCKEQLNSRSCSNKKQTKRAIMIQNIIKLRKSFNNKYQAHKNKRLSQQIFSSNLFQYNSDQKLLQIAKRGIKRLKQNSQFKDSLQLNNNYSVAKIRLSDSDSSPQSKTIKRKCLTQNIQILDQNDGIAIIIQKQQDINAELQNSFIEQRHQKNNLYKKTKINNKCVQIYNFQTLKAKHLGHQIKQLRSKYLKKQKKSNLPHSVKKFSKQQYNKYGIMVTSINQQKNKDQIDENQFQNLQDNILLRWNRTTQQQRQCRQKNMSTGKTFLSKIFRKDYPSGSPNRQRSLNKKKQNCSFKILDPWDIQQNSQLVQNQFF